MFFCLCYVLPLLILKEKKKDISKWLFHNYLANNKEIIITTILWNLIIEQSVITAQVRERP